MLASFKTASDADEQLIKDATTVNRKIQGTRVPKKETTQLDPNTPAPETISASQQSYEMKYDHFKKLVEIISSEPTYNPNETELQITKIQDYLNELSSANQNVANTYETENQARIKRDKTLYDSKNGVYKIQELVKEYIKGAFGTDSIHYKQMVAIKFNKPKKTIHLTQI